MTASTLLLAACGDAQTIEPAHPPVANTPQVLILTAAPTLGPTSTTVAIPAATQTPVVSETPTAAPSPTPAPSATPTTAPTAAPTLTPTAIAATTGVSNHTVLLPRISPSATTGITSTDQFSLTVVPPPVGRVRLPEGTINIALLGIDTRLRRGSGAMKPETRGLSDVIIIASIQPTVPAVTLLSIPRDTLVYLPNARYAKINTAYARGPEYFKQVVKYNLGLNVDYYVTVNFSTVVNAVNTLGGIDVVATCPLYQVFPRDPYYMADAVTPLTVTVPYTNSFTGEVWQPGQAVPTQTIWIPRAGVYSLNGMQTLAYARARYGVPGGDIDRGRRTQKVVRGMLTKARSNGLAFFAQLPALIDQFGRSMQTDLTVDQILSLGTFANQLDDAVVRSRYLDGVGLTGMNLPEVGSILVPNRGNITGYLQQAMNVPVNQQAGNSVEVEFWNGTGWDDFSPAAADRLRELDLAVVSVKELDEVVTRTQIIDFTTTAKGSALPKLQRAFQFKPNQITQQPQAEGPRFRIIAGRDFDPCYYRNNAATRAVPDTTNGATNDDVNGNEDLQPTATPDPNATPVTTDPLVTEATAAVDATPIETADVTPTAPVELPTLPPDTPVAPPPEPPGPTPEG